MEDLHFNQRSEFTRWVVRKQLLREPLVLIDVGVLGGEHGRWHLLGEYLVVHGFDAIEAEVEKLRQREASNPNRHYHWMAIGSEDGEREFHINAANPTSSSIYLQGADRSLSYGARQESLVRVPIRRLDSLLADGTLSSADFVKVDVEGFEKDVFAGSKELLKKDVLGVETETNFGTSPTYPAGHFATLQHVLLEHHLLVCDLGYNRVPRAAFQEALRRDGKSLVTDTQSVGKISTMNALFMRDLVDEADRPHHYLSPPRPVSVDKMLKAMIIYELYGLNDMALDIAVRFRDEFGTRLDVDRAVSLLADSRCREAPEMAQELRILRQKIDTMEHSRSWRLTAPLRSLQELLRRATASTR